MGSDAMVALGRATVDGQTLFGQKSDGMQGCWQPLCCTEGRTFAGDEKVRTRHFEVPQARQTYKVLASQPAGVWGYDHGLNEHQVAAGCTPLRRALPGCGSGLLGTDFIRLALERSRTARQAVQLVTDLVQRYGQCPPCDHALLIADPAEAYALETAGSHWVYQEVHEIRVQSNVRVVRQDWDRISQGLASQAIDQGSWPADGSKLDFAGALGEDASERSGAMARWGRMTLLLQEQNGHIDTAFLRHVLGDRDDDDTDSVEWEPDSTTSATSFVCRLSADPNSLPMGWFALGPPCLSVYFPFFLHGEMPAPFTTNASAGAGIFGLRLSRLGELVRRDRKIRVEARDLFARLQARFDQEAEEFVGEGTALKKQGQLTDLQRQASYFMQYNLERFETALADLLAERAFAQVTG